MKKEHLQDCQVETPHEIVDLVWRIACAARASGKFGNVIDLGAGDARFAAKSSAYRKYTGIEMDRTKANSLTLPKNANVIVADAMSWEGSGYGLCIGNPPYIRHHNLDPKWRTTVLNRIAERSGVELKQTANLFILFLMQGLLSTHDKGLVVQLIPFEWVTRPNAAELRAYIDSKKWNVTVYRFNVDIFPTVLTTASITVIDKASSGGQWKFAEIGKDGLTKELKHPSGHSEEVLTYKKKRDENLYCLRGLSPGGQDIFVLTEEERLHFSLRKNRDVIPCVTSLRAVPIEAHDLTTEMFKQHFIDAGRRCWLICSHKDTISSELKNYLSSVGDRWTNYATCVIREVWWRYKSHPKPLLLVASGFVGTAPKVLVNSIGAIAAGSVYGVISLGDTVADQLAAGIRAYDFEKRVVSHSNNLKKVEVRQLNTVLAQLNAS